MKILKDFKLVVSALGNTVYFAKTSKKNPALMTDQRVEVPKSDFLKAMVDFLSADQLEYDEKERYQRKTDYLPVTIGGVEKFRIRLEPVNQEPIPETAKKAS